MVRHYGIPFSDEPHRPEVMLQIEHSDQHQWRSPFAAALADVLKARRGHVLGGLARFCAITVANGRNCDDAACRICACVLALAG